MTVTPVDPSIVENAVRLVASDGITLIAILDLAYTAVVSEQLLDDVGGEETFTFNLPLNDPKVALIKNEMCLRITRFTHDPSDAAFQVTMLDSVYVVRTITKGYDDSGTKSYQVYAEARWYDLTTDDLITVQPALPDATSAMTAILAGTSWTVGVVGVPAAAGSVAWGSADLITPLAALRSLPAIFGGELVFDTVNRQVSLIPRRGDQNPHLLYIHGGNMSHDVRTIDTTQLTTRVHPLGANNIDITSVNGNVPYIEDYSYFDNNGLAHQVRAQAITNDLISDPAALLAWAQNQLAIMAQPITRWDIGIALIAGKAIPRLGDLVRVTDETMGLDTYARCSRREFNVIQPWLTVLTVDTAAYTLATPGSGGTGLPTGSSGTDYTIPDPPTGLHLNFGSGLDANGNWNTYGVATWTAPVANTDGTPISDLDHYDLEIQVSNSPGQWIPVGATGDVTAGFGYVPANFTVTVRVRAVDHSGNRSAWDQTAAIIPLPSPFYRPPSTPTLDVSTFPLCIQVLWNGLDNNNVPYPADVDFIEVHLVQGSGAFTPTASTLHSSVPAILGGFVEPLTGLTAGAPYTVELVALGRSDTRSLPSVPVTGVCQPVGPTHLVYNGDQDNMVPDGSFETIAGRARLMNDPSWSSAWSFITAGNAPGGLGAAAIADGFWALQGLGGTNTGNNRALHLTTVSAQAGQKIWAKLRYINQVTGGLCSFGVAVSDSAGTIIASNVINLDPVASYSLASFTYTLPATAASYTFFVQMDQTCSAGYLLVDAVELRSIIQTAIIDNLAVTYAQIESVDASSIRASTLSADILLAARIKTADTGARVEISSSGLFAFNSGGGNTVAIHNDGSATFTGTITGSVIQTAASGKRVVLDPSVSTGLIEFYSGAVGETVPGVIRGDVSGGGYLQLVGPTQSGVAGGGITAQAGAAALFDPNGNEIVIAGSAFQPTAITMTGAVEMSSTLVIEGTWPVLASPDASASKMVCAVITDTTDSNGYMVETHFLGQAPTAVFVETKAPIGGVASLPFQTMVDSFTGSTFRVRAFDQAGNPFASTSVTFVYMAVRG